MSLAPNQIYQRQERIVTRQIAGETLLVPIYDEAVDIRHLFSFNPVAAHIWNALDGSTPLADVILSVQEHFEVAPEQAEQDALTFVDELLSAKLITTRRDG